MPKPTADEVLTQQSRRLFFQDGGPFPNNLLKYAGVETQYMVLEGVTRPISGGIEPVRVYDPNRPKKFKFVGRKATAPDFPTATLRILEKRSVLPFQLGDLTCPFNLYLPNGLCKDPSDFLNGWDSFVEVVSFAETTEVDEGDRMAWEDDNQGEDALFITLESKYAVGAIGIGAKASTEVAREVVDIVYGSTLQCGDCGPQDDGTKRIYAVTKSSGAAAPGLPAELVYTLDGGATWTETSITSFGATEDPLGIDMVADKLVIIGAAAYFWATINSKTGVPGAFTKVTSGFVANKAPVDLYVLGTKVYFCGNGGYIYRADNITSGVTVVSAADATAQDFFRIDGDGGEVIVATAGNSDVVVSTNRGVTWSVTVTEPTAITLNLTALEVKTNLHWWVGSSQGAGLYYTLNGGETWTYQPFTGAGTGFLRDIVFATDEVGYFVHDDNTPTGRLWATWNGGVTWVRNDGGSNRILNWPTLNRINRLAVPNAQVQTDSNNIALAGLSAGGTDGILLVGQASEF